MAEERVEMPASMGEPGPEAPMPVAGAIPVAIVVPTPIRAAEQRGQDPSPVDKAVGAIVPVGIIPERLVKIDWGAHDAAVFQRIVPVAGTEKITVRRPVPTAGDPNGTFAILTQVTRPPLPVTVAPEPAAWHKETVFLVGVI